jgi:hypothetical protein
MVAYRADPPKQRGSRTWRDRENARVSRARDAVIDWTGARDWGGYT